MRRSGDRTGRGKLTSTGLLKLGIASVGIGGTVYTKKSASANPIAAAMATRTEVKCITVAVI
jgi:hypothetical protein